MGIYLNNCRKCGNIFDQKWKRCRHCGSNKAINYEFIVIILLLLIVAILGFLIWKS